MTLENLGAIIRAIRSIEPDRRIILFGSSSLLGSLSSDLPECSGVEVTIDADIFLDPDDDDVRQTLLRAMGEGRQYHQDHGFYCDFVDAKADRWFPQGWRQRLLPFGGFEDVFAMQAADVVAAKLVATAHSRVDKRMGRRPHDRGTKDIETATALLHARLVNESEIVERMHSIGLDPACLAELAAVWVEVHQRLGLH